MTRGTATHWLGLAVVLGVLGSPPSATAQGRAPASRQKVVAVGLPSHFVENDGITDPRAHFFLLRPGYSLFVAGSDVVAAVGRPARRGAEKDAGAGPPSGAFRIRLVEADPAARGRGRDRARARATFSGDAKRPQRSTSLYRSVVVPQVYPGIDYRLEAEGGAVRYAFEVAPGARHERIQFVFDGADPVLRADGTLALRLPHGIVVQTAPRFFERRDGRRRELEGGFHVSRSGVVSFRVRGRDPQASLVIDPEILFSTYLGGAGEESNVIGPWDVEGVHVSVIAPGKFVAAATTHSSVFPDPALLASPATAPPPATIDVGSAACAWRITLGAVQPLDYLHCVTEGETVARDVVALPNGEAYLAGVARSSEFVTLGGYFPDRASPQSEAGFLIRLDAAGSRTASTWVSPRLSLPYGVDAETGAHAGVTTAGWERDSTAPATCGAWVGGGDVFVARFSLDLSDLVFFSIFGGTGGDRAYDVDVADGRPLVGGTTTSPDFPHNLGHSSSPIAGRNAFLTRLPTGGCLPDPLGPATIDAFSLLYAEPGDQGVSGVAAGDRPAMVGYVETAAEHLQVFLLDVREVASHPSFVSTVFGSSTYDRGGGVAVRSDDRTAVVGELYPARLDFEIPPGAFSLSASGNTFLALFDPPPVIWAATPIPTQLYFLAWGYATDIDLDANDCAYIAGLIYAPDELPLVEPLQTGLAGGSDAWLMQICDVPPQLAVTKQRLDPVEAAAFGWSCTSATPDQPGEVCFEIRVDHLGGDPVAGAQLTDTLDPAAAVADLEARGTQVDCPPVDPGEASVTCDLPPFAEDDSVWVAVRVTLAPDVAEGLLCDEARVTAGDAAWPVEGPTSLCVPIETPTGEPVSEPGELLVTKSVRENLLSWDCARPNVCFEVLVEPDGGGAPTGYQLIDDLPAGLSLDDWEAAASGVEVECHLDAAPPACDVPAGAGIVVVYLHGVLSEDAGDALCNSITVEGTAAQVEVVPACFASGEAVEPPGEPASLSLEKRLLDAARAADHDWECAGRSVAVGEQACFLVRVAHEEGGVSDPFVLRDDVGSAFYDVDFHASGMVCNPEPLGVLGDLRCAVDPIAPRGFAELHLRATLSDRVWRKKSMLQDGHCNVARTQSAQVTPQESKVCIDPIRPQEPHVELRVRGPDNIPRFDRSSAFLYIDIEHLGGGDAEDVTLEIDTSGTGGELLIRNLRSDLGCWVIPPPGSGPVSQMSCGFGDLRAGSRSNALVEFEASSTSGLGRALCPEVRLRFRPELGPNERVIGPEREQCLELARICHTDDDCFPGCEPSEIMCPDAWECRTADVEWAPPRCLLEIPDWFFGGGCAVFEEEEEGLQPQPECQP